MLDLTDRKAPAPSSAPHAPGPDPSLGDLRFRKLLTDAEWHRLPLAIRRRFSKRLSGGRTVVYTGTIVETEISGAGMILAQLARAIGAPLPISRDIDVPSVVTVTEDVATAGQIWTRLYARRDRFPQVIQSSKQFKGASGLEEHVGGGFGMRLGVETGDSAILFRSQDYFWQAFGRQVSLPRWLAPGALTVGHHELGNGRFAFTLDIVHPWFGRLIQQRGIFEEARVH